MSSPEYRCRHISRSRSYLRSVVRQILRGARARRADQGRGCVLRAVDDSKAAAPFVLIGLLAVGQLNVIP